MAGALSGLLLLVGLGSAAGYAMAVRSEALLDRITTGSLLTLQSAERARGHMLEARRAETAFRADRSMDEAAKATAAAQRAAAEFASLAESKATDEIAEAARNGTDSCREYLADLAQVVALN